MNTSNPTAPVEVYTQEARSAAERKVFLAAGIFYLLTFVSIPTLSLYAPLHKPGYMLQPGNDNPVIVGGLLEIIVALSGIATAVILYPLLKKYGNRLALGLVASRILEASTMFAGVAFLLTVVSLHQQGAGAQVTSQALVTLYDRIFCWDRVVSLPSMIYCWDFYYTGRAWCPGVFHSSASSAHCPWWQATSLCFLVLLISARRWQRYQHCWLPCSNSHWEFIS